MPAPRLCEMSDKNVIPFPGGRTGVSQRGWEPLTRHNPILSSPRARAAGYAVHVELDGSEPTIWRDLVLASDLRLTQVHELLQTAMGWTGSHLHQFTMGPERDVTVRPFVTDLDEEEDDDGIQEGDVRLDQVLAEPGDRLFYEYDLGDGWDHSLRLEAVTAQLDGAPRARCVAGKGSCPPEDCGGIGGYHEILTALADPASADENLRVRLEWLGEGFDPEAFDAHRTDDLLQLTLTRSLGALVPPEGDFSTSLRDLTQRSRWTPTSPLAELIVDARLGSSVLPDAEARAELVRPWLRILELVGDEGMALTQAGFMRPAIVSTLAAELVEAQPWMGKVNREEHTPPVAQLRTSATAMRLVRKTKGRLVLTSAGRAIGGNADRMWDRLVSSLPLGKQDHQRDAGVVALLALAAGTPPGEGVRRVGPVVLTQAGWRMGDGELNGWAAYDAARPTLEVLSTAGCLDWGQRDETAPESAQRLARAALTTPG